MTITVGTYINEWFVDIQDFNLDIIEKRNLFYDIGFHIYYSIERLKIDYLFAISVIIHLASIQNIYLNEPHWIIH